MEATALSARQLLLVAAGIVLLAGLVALLVARVAARGSGFRPTLRGGASVVASDTGAGASVLLSDPALGLRGRPDYLLEEGDDSGRVLVPLEVKPKRRSHRLYESDALQLGAYLVAARASFGPDAVADFGYVRYAETLFRVHLTPSLERRLREVVAAIRKGRTATVLRRSHGVRARCSRCPVRMHCDDAL
jgi:hypothetical protein